MKTIATLAAASALLALPALAQHSEHGGAKPGDMPASKGGMSSMQHGNMPASKGGMGQTGHMAHQEDMQTMQRMHQAMMAKQDADPDRAFALKMIEHHRAGIAMAQTVQKHGDDAEAKKMAQDMANEQRKDIAELESWLDRHGGRAPKP